MKNKYKFLILLTFGLLCLVIIPSVFAVLSEDDTEESYSCTAGIVGCANAVDENWATLADAGTWGVDRYVFENYTIPLNFINADLTTKTRGINMPKDAYCWNYSSLSWTSLGTFSGGVAPVNDTFIVYPECLNSILQTRVHLFDNTFSQGTEHYYEGRIDWNLTSTQESQQYETDNILETSAQQFNTTILFEAGEDPIVILIYNETVHFSLQIEKNTNNATYQSNIQTPLVTSGNAENKTFSWNITDSLATYSTDETNQSVNRIYITNCTSPAITNSINFTMKDEETKGNLVGDVSSTWIFWASTGSGVIFRNYSIKENNQNIHDFCLFPSWAELKVNTDLESTDTGYVIRTYFLDNFPLNNETQSITLYLLNIHKSLDFQFSLLDEIGDPIPDSLIQVQKYYRDEGIAKTVEILKTDSSGRDVAHLNDDSEYQTIVIINGEVKHIGLPFQPYCPQATVGEKCEREIRLGTDTSTLLHQTYAGFSDSLTYKDSSTQFIYTWVDSMGVSHTARLYVVRKGLTDEVICDVSTTSASGTLICDVTGNTTGELTAWAYNTHSLERVEHFLTQLFTTYHETFGDDGLFWGFIIIFSLFCLGLATQSLANSLIFLGIGVFAVKVFGFIFIPYYSLIVLVLIIAVAVWRLKSL